MSDRPWFFHYTLEPGWFIQYKPLKLVYILNASINDDCFQLTFTPPGAPDSVVVEGRLDKVRIYLHDGDELVYGYAYLVGDQVFLLSFTDIDAWLDEHIAEYGAMDDFNHPSVMPCWVSMEVFWTVREKDHPHVALELVDFFGVTTLRHARYGREIDPKTLLYTRNA